MRDRPVNRRQEHVLSEYEDVSDNIRQHSNMRFAQMTLFFAITGVLLALFANPTLLQSKFQISPPEPLQLIDVPAATLIALGGILSSLVFWTMEERVNDYWHHYVRRAKELERVLHFTQYSTRPAKRFVTATNAVRMLYVVVALFWILSARTASWFTFLLILYVIAYFCRVFLPPFWQRPDA